MEQEEIDFFYGEQLKKMKEDWALWNTLRVEAHERWSYNEQTKTQKLERIIALCHRCHTVTHHGLAGLRGLEKFANKHLMKVNGWAEEQTKNHIKQQRSIWEERNKVEWILDLKVITDSGIRLFTPNWNIAQLVRAFV